MRDLDEGSASEEENFQRCRQKRARRGTATANGKDKATTAAAAAATVAEEEGPAGSCQSCRKKKAKCSRNQPCSQCVRFDIDCLYDDKRTKPGLRTGAVENLNQRVVALENMFLGQGLLWQQVWKCLSLIQPESPGISSLHQGNGSHSVDTLKECTGRLKNTLSSLSMGHLESTDPDLKNTLKRKHTSVDIDLGQSQAEPVRAGDTTKNDLPPDDLIDSLVEIYFTSIHPWIPILHVRQFREKMAAPVERQKLTTIFHAIVSLCVRFSEDPRLENPDVRARYAKRSRQTVILQSMESFSVENLQALVICAFDTIGSGRGPSAWSIVGSMTRTVEQLQLSVEDEDQPQSAEFFIKRMAFLRPAKSWIEREDRRRVFWNVFLMDRFCSIATGWNFSLTSADVKRRLPCEGSLWEEGNPLSTPTPYFGVADKSSNSALPASRPELEDQDSIGGFAYCIEALESLSLVTTFFLRHAVNVSDVHDLQVWLMRFKELDLRLVQWKIYLPERWREACALNRDGIMDPNLTLAHITHNTAVGLLHQGIAYPSQEWQLNPIRLPSVASAETCLAAATEVAIIAEKYLQGSSSLTNPQFAFCLFISGRMLLAHSLHYNVPLPLQFDSLTTSLLEISRRWNGPHARQGLESETENLASKFASRLVQARHKGPNALDIRQPAYSEEQDHSGTSDTPQRTLRSGASAFRSTKARVGIMSPLANAAGQNENGDMDASMMVDQEDSPDSISLAFPPLPLAFQPHCANSVQGGAFFGEQDESCFSSIYPHPNAMQYGGGSGLDDLNSFFDYSFPPTQRISMFSGPPGEGDHQQA